MITTSRPSDWDHLQPEPGGTVRSLATSVVSIERRELALNDVGRTATAYVTCPSCKGLRRASLNPHAPRWFNGKRIDCAGREVAP